ncbi:MAG: hypothetical protein ABR582_10210 [Gemmatimonadaceae bacterium]
MNADDRAAVTHTTPPVVTQRPQEMDDLRAEALRRSVVPLWLGFLVPPSMALGNVEFGYVLNHIACDMQTRVYLHIFMFCTLAITLFAGWLAWREWVVFGRVDPGEISGPLGSRRFMALVGWVGALTGAWLIISQWFPVFVLGPCIRT